MAQSHTDRSHTRFTDVVEFIHAVEDLACGEEARLAYSVFDTRHLLIARRTGLGSLYLTAVDQERSLPMSTDEYEVANSESRAAIREIVGKAVEVFLGMEYDDHELSVLDVERIGE